MSQYAPAIHVQVNHCMLMSLLCCDVVFASPFVVCQEHVISNARRFGRHILHAHRHDRFSDHSIGLHKWWKAHVKINGMITEHISPYQQKVLSPMFHNLPGKLLHKVTDNWQVIPAVAILGYFKYWCDHKYHHLLREEWP
jgi:hypothetical protein